jgi:VWFA-related protein
MGLSSLLLLSPSVEGAVDQKSGVAAPDVFGETVDVRVVNVEAVVTDRDGNRVPGMAAGDFRLTVDGEEVPVQYFAEIRGGEGVSTSASSGRPCTPGPTCGWHGGPIETSYLVFIDEYFTTQRDRDLALERLRSELPALGPEDRMAIVAYDGDRVDMLLSWSRSGDELDTVLRDAERRPAYGFQRWAERRSYDLDRRLPAAYRFRRTAFDLTPEESFYSHLLADQVERTTLAAASTARGFAAPPGRKVMLLLTGGWPFDPVRFAVDSSFRAPFEPGVATGPDLYRPLVDTVNLLGYTLYPVDLAGNQATAFPGSLAAIADSASPRELSFDREQELHASLEFLAVQTGGKALINAKAEEPFAAAVADTRSYYWLGFTPDRRGDDRSHAIEVSLREPGYKVRSRRDYFDYSRSRELSLAVESALLFGNPPGPQPLEASLGAPRDQGRNRMVIPLTLLIPADAVAFVPADGGFTARLELRVAALGENGDSADVPVIPVDLVSPHRPAAGETFTYTTELSMRRRAHDMVVALNDPVSGAFLSTALQIAPLPGGST